MESSGVYRHVPSRSEDIGLVDHPKPCAIWLAPSHLNRCSATDQPRRGECQVAMAERRLLFPCRERGPVGEQPLVGLTDRLAAGDDLAGWEGQQGVGFVQRHQPIDVACVGPFHEEPAQVLRPCSSFAFAVVAPPSQLLSTSSDPRGSCIIASPSLTFRAGLLAACLAPCSIPRQAGREPTPRHSGQMSTCTSTIQPPAPAASRQAPRRTPRAGEPPRSASRPAGCPRRRHPGRGRPGRFGPAATPEHLGQAECRLLERLLQGRAVGSDSNAGDVLQQRQAQPSTPRGRDRAALEDVAGGRRPLRARQRGRRCQREPS